jgi:hypothetical protein
LAIIDGCSSEALLSSKLLDRRPLQQRWDVVSMFKYGYVVKLPSGLLVRSGQDWSPTLDSFKVGDSLGVKNGKEGVVLAVVKGGDANRNGYDVMIVLEERPARSEGQTVVQRMAQMAQELESPRLTSRPQIQTDFRGNKIRAVRNAIYIRPQEETFHDFQINLLLWVLGEPWFNAEMAKPLEDRHIVLRWRHERNELFRAHRKPEDDPKKPVKAPFSGNVKALQVLADDIYQLEHALKTPSRIIDRLRDSRQFQGSRYEIAVASLLARCGFTINFINDTSKRNPEFIAEKGAERIAVEAKSRCRPGILEEPPQAHLGRCHASAKIKEHYEEALQQNPGGMPFLVFIDVNLPLTPQISPMEKDWVKEAMKCFEDRRQEGKLTDPDTGLLLTNFGWHYSRDPGSPSGECVYALRENPQYPIAPDTWQCLLRALAEYGLVVDDEEHQRRVRAQFPEFGMGA